MVCVVFADRHEVLGFGRKKLQTWLGAMVPMGAQSGILMPVLMSSGQTRPGAGPRVCDCPEFRVRHVEAMVTLGTLALSIHMF